MNEVRLERIKAVLTIVITALANIANVYGFTVDADALVQAILCILSAFTIAWSWWKNQNITVEAVAAQRYLEKLKADKGGEECE